MPVFEIGSTAAILQGVLLFGALSVLGCLVGLGTLSLAGVVSEPERQLLLAPFIALVVWALLAGLSIRAGLTMATTAPYVAVISIVLAVRGVWQAARLRSRVLPAAVIVVVCWIVSLLLVWPYVARGLTATLGSPNMDTVMYTEMAAAYWRHGVAETMPRTLFFERLSVHFEYLALARNHTFALLALFSPLVEAGEPLLVRNIFVCWSLFVLACSMAFYGASWRLGPGSDARSWYATAVMVAGVGVGWAVVPMLVGNWDNGLFTSVGPVMAGLLVQAPTAGIAYPALLGTVAAYGIYTFPELAPVLYLILTPIAAAHLLAPSSRRAVTRSLGVAMAVGLVVLAMGAKGLLDFFVIQVGHAQAPVTSRAGGAFAQGLVLSRVDPSAWWALGAEHSPSVALSAMSICGALLTALALLGWLRLWRQRARGEVAAVAVLAMIAGYFALVDVYGYGVYKVLSVGWCLVALVLVEGASTVATWRPVVGTRMIERAVVGLVTAGVLTVITISLVTSTLRRWEVYASDPIAQSQPSVASLMRLRAAASAQPFRDVFVSHALSDSYTLPWIFYALKDSRVWPFHGADVSPRVPAAAAWKYKESADTTLMRTGEAHGARRVFRLPEFELVDSKTLVVLSRVDTPNRPEAWGTWLGTSPIALTVKGAPGLRAMVRFEAEPGPSLPETPERALSLRAGDVALGSQRITRPTMVAFTFVTTGEEQVLELSTPDRPTIARMPNGDDRALLVSIKKLAVAPSAQ